MVYTLEDYERELRKENEDGLLTAEELADALTHISPPNLGRIAPTITIEERSQDDPTITRLEDLYYRELFGRPKRNRDPHLPDIALLGLYNGKPAGALWYALEPTPAYTDCAYLDMLYVKDEFRGSKVASHLLVDLVERAVGEQAIITYAWKSSIDCYAKHGFLRTDEEAAKGGERFLKMVLPLTKRAWQYYEREMELEALEQYRNLIGSGPEGKEFLERLSRSIDSCTAEQEQEPMDNPFTVFMYQKAGKEHGILK